MRSNKLSFTTRYVLLFGLLLFVANTVLGIVTFNRSRDAMRTLIRKDMLDLVNSAAASLDGDVMDSLTEDDVDGPVFRDIADRLLVFQRSTDIEFIYAIKQVDENTFIFTVDPDPVDPGVFGEEVVTTPAMIEAGSGTPSVDTDAISDRWGTFYSAFSPIIDSSGKIVGVVGVDFDANWYQSQLRGYLVSIASITALSVILGGVVVGIISNRVRRRFRELDASLSLLSGDVDLLMDEMASYSGYEVVEAQAHIDDAPEISDELGNLGGKIHTMQGEMGLYLDYLRMQAYTDSLTKVGNSTAYHEAVRAIDERIANGTADFWVAVFDLNSLKELNDDFGHECGDVYIQGAAQALMASFGNARIYRIGGDEFAAIAEGGDEAQMNEALQRFSEALDDFNASAPYPAKLSLSKGVSSFRPGQDEQFTDVFTRADQIMYEDKREYYRREPQHDRRGGGRRHRLS